MLEKTVDKLDPEANKILLLEFDKAENKLARSRKVINYIAIVLNKDKNYYPIIKNTIIEDKVEELFYEKAKGLIHFLRIFHEEIDVHGYSQHRDYDTIEELGWITTKTETTRKEENKQILKTGVLTEIGREISDGYQKIIEEFSDLY